MAELKILGETNTPQLYQHGVGVGEDLIISALASAAPSALAGLSQPILVYDKKTTDQIEELSETLEALTDRLEVLENMIFGEACLFASSSQKCRY